MIGRMRHAVRQRQREGAFEPVAKRVRALLDGATVVDSRRAVLVWEPRRIVPSYAVPEADILGEVIRDPRPALPDDGFPTLHPGIPFAVHTAPGEPVLVRAPGGPDAAAGFRLADPELDGVVVLDFGGFDAWMEEDEPIVSHPRDPFHRVDTMRSSRHVRVELGGELLAETRRPVLLFETSLPMRSYIPREDVRMELLVPTGTRTRCAYKGEARYWSVEGAGAAGEDLAWSYEAPLHDAAAGEGPDRLLRRAHRRDDRRRAHGAAQHAVEPELGRPDGLSGSAAAEVGEHGQDAAVAAVGLGEPELPEDVGDVLLDRPVGDDEAARRSRRSSAPPP